MRRLLFVAALALLALQASGLASWMVPTDCTESCEDDSGGICSPACSCCSCCFHPRTCARREGARLMPGPAATGVVVIDADGLPESPPPGEIFRVPRSARA